MTDRFGADPDRRRVWPGPHPATVAARLLLLGLVGSLSVYATGDPAKAFWAVLLAVIGVPAVLAAQHRFLGPLSRAAEVLVTVLAADVVVGNALPTNELFRGGAAAAAILPYLLVPVVAAALYRRRVEWLALLALAAALLLVLAFTDVPAADRGAYLVAAAEWLLFTTLAAGVTDTLQRTIQERRDSPQPYAAATRLLTQLRTVGVAPSARLARKGGEGVSLLPLPLSTASATARICGDDR